MIVCHSISIAGFEYIPCGSWRQTRPMKYVYLRCHFYKLFIPFNDSQKCSISRYWENKKIGNTSDWSVMCVLYINWILISYCNWFDCWFESTHLVIHFLCCKASIRQCREAGTRETYRNQTILKTIVINVGGCFFFSIGHIKPINSCFYDEQKW